MKKLHVDIETYSETDISNCGVYKYVEDPKFEILLIAYAVGHDRPTCIDLARGESDAEFKAMLLDPEYTIVAHNATFERLSLSKHYGVDIPIERFECTMALSARSGLPLGLGDVANALGLETTKMSVGREMIKYYCVPSAPNKKDGRTRNLPCHRPDTKAKQWSWDTFKEYCIRDVEVEQEIYHTLHHANLSTPTERQVYILDQRINDRGVAMDLDFINGAVIIDTEVKEQLMDELRTLTGLDNPKSDAQLKKWLVYQWGKPIESLAKPQLPTLIAESLQLTSTNAKAIQRALELRKELGKTSTAKYTKMQDVVCSDGRGKGFIQYYGANRTGRFAGRLVQVQNLPQNHLDEGVMDAVRDSVKLQDTESLQMAFTSVTDTLSQMIRTAFVPSQGKVFAVADYAQIEARVIAWIAGEQWRIDTFKRGEDIYISSASMMFGIPREQIDKGSDLRVKGKVAELACGFGGGVGAIKAFAKPKDFLTTEQLNAPNSERLFEETLQRIITKWRNASPRITQLWRNVEAAFSEALATGELRRVRIKGNPTHLNFRREGDNLTIELPSGRKLFYYKPDFTINRFGNQSVCYWGMNQTTKQWQQIESYGGKLVENIVQAVARDLLCEVMLRIEAEGYPIVLHVHDEAIAEVNQATAQQDFDRIIEIMAEPIEWANGLPTKGAGFLTSYYKKD